MQFAYTLKAVLDLISLRQAMLFGLSTHRYLS